MSNSTERDQRYGVKPRNVALTRETLPQLSAKMPHGYCKRLKAVHVFELADVKVYKQHSYLGNYAGPMYLVGLTHYKEYRCTGCGKKRVDREEFKLDQPVERERIAV